jgi:hypothetical protein
MDPSVSQTLALERVARVLAAWKSSSNADGGFASAGPEVNQDWPDHLESALAVLKSLREPDQAMAAVGDPDLWSRMVDAAIAARPRLDLPEQGFPTLPTVREAGQQDGPWTDHDQRSDESFPASDPPPASPGVD